MYRASYYSVYICRPTRCTDSYNETLCIINRFTCFGLLSPSSEAAYTNCDTASKNVASDDGLKSPKHVKRLMINKDSL